MNYFLFRISLRKFILAMAVCLLASCNPGGSEDKFIKLSDEELISLFENFNRPKVDSLILKDSDGNGISLDSFKNIKDPFKYTIDYYKNSIGNIKQGILRLRTQEDDKLNDRIFKITLEQSEIEEIQNLGTVGLRDVYLKNLWDEDQGLRDGTDSEIMAKYGMKSKEYKTYMVLSIKANKRIFQKIKYYLEYHQYPKEKEKYHWKSINAFQAIIGHSSSYNEQREVLDHMIVSYKKGYCEKDDLVWILGEMHERKNYGKRYKMKSKVVTTDIEFDELCAVLGIVID